MSPHFILLVEDDVNLRQSIALILLRSGYIVTSTDCSDKAIELLRFKNYHLLISDIDVPETSRTMLPTIVLNHPQLPILLLTDNPDDQIGGDEKQSSAFYLVKPVAPERLLDLVSSILYKKLTNQFTNQLQPVDLL